MTCSDIAQLDLPVKLGTDFRRRFRFKNSTGGLVDLNGYAILFKGVYGSAEIATALSILEPTINGEADLWLNVAMTRQVPQGRLMQYAIELREPGSSPPGSGDQIVPVEGYLVGEQGQDNDD